MYRGYYFEVKLGVEAIGIQVYEVPLTVDRALAIQSTCINSLICMCIVYKVTYHIPGHVIFGNENFMFAKNCTYVYT